MRLHVPAAGLRLPRRTLRAQLALLYAALFCASFVAVAAVALGGVAVAVELSAESTYNQAKAEVTSQTRRDSLYDSANSTRHVAQGLAVGGAVSAVAAVWLYLRGRREDGATARTARRMEIVPAGAGFAIAGRY